MTTMHKLVSSEDREIILALFAPDTGHKDGCLFRDNPNLPCQCGFVEVVGRYRWAVKRAQEISRAHYGATYEAKSPPLPPAAPPEPTPSLTPDERERVKAVLTPFAVVAADQDLQKFRDTRPLWSVSEKVFINHGKPLLTVGDLRAVVSLLADLTKEGK